MKYVYPAVLKPLPNGEYAVKIPDLPGCVTCGKDLPDTLDMAQDAISMWICDAEDCKEVIPPASNISSTSHDEGEFTTLIAVDTIQYRNLNDNRAIKKTLTIPNWLNTKAEKAGINFSQTLQKSLKNELGLE